MLFAHLRYLDFFPPAQFTYILTLAITYIDTSVHTIENVYEYHIIFLLKLYTPAHSHSLLVFYFKSSPFAL